MFVLSQLIEASSQDWTGGGSAKISKEDLFHVDTVCNDQLTNCKPNEESLEVINDEDKAEETESNELQTEDYPEYKFADGDYFKTEEDGDEEEIFYVDFGEEVDDDNLEEPVEEVEPFSFHTDDDTDEGDKVWSSHSLQRNSKEVERIGDYPLDEECKEKINKKQKPDIKKDKWKRKRQMNLRMKDCCMKGKRIGLKARVYKSDNLFRACRETIRNNMPRIAHRCQWIMQTCCENKALRRYYVHKKVSF